uniref:Uncharacterized protein n=1 Tax=Arundo donax TaxID=35708 RepID=A0A0A8YBA4_ARUDO
MAGIGRSYNAVVLWILAYYFIELFP